MGALAYIRQMHIDAEYYARRKLITTNTRRRAAPGVRPHLRGLLESPRILLPATRADRHRPRLEAGADVKRPAVIYGAHEAFTAADLLKKSGTPVLVSLKWPERSRDANPDLPESLRTLELRDKAPSTPAALAKAGVKFAFYTDKIERPRDAVRAVRRAIEAVCRRTTRSAH